MQIETICNIIDGKLLNNPTISSTSSYHIDPKKIKYGDTYICFDKSKIKEAISFGAFVIIADFLDDRHIKQDNDIAWIIVENIKDATVSLKRFLLSTQDTKAYFCDKITYELFRDILVSKDIVKFLKDDIRYDFDIINNNTNNIVYISQNRHYLKNIFPLCKILNEKKQIKPTELQIHSIFDISFKFQEKNYKIMLPRLYLENFLNIVSFCDKYEDINIDENILNIKKFRYFAPIFVDSFLNIVEFGKSNHLIIANSDNQIIKPQIEFLKSNYKYGTINIIQKTNKDILSQISLSCNINYIVGFDYQDIVELLDKKMALKQNISLF